METLANGISDRGTCDWIDIKESLVRSACSVFTVLYFSFGDLVY